MEEGHLTHIRDKASQMDAKHNSYFQCDSSVRSFSPPLSHATPSTHGYGGQCPLDMVPENRSIAMIHYWVRHAKCTWSSFNLYYWDSIDSWNVLKCKFNQGASTGEIFPRLIWIYCISLTNVPSHVSVTIMWVVGGIFMFLFCCMLFVSEVNFLKIQLD